MKIRPLHFLLSLMLAAILPLSLSAFNTGTNNPVVVDVTGTNPTCPGFSDGTATATASGGWEPYTYVWNTGDTTETITGLPAGTYSVTVTDIDLAIAIGEITLVDPDPIVWFTNSNYETCIGSADAHAGIFPSGGTPPYTYLWSTGDTTWNAENLGAGTYGVTVTDANGCSIEDEVIVEVSPEGVWIMSTSTDVTCFGANDGTAYAGPMTGTPPYTFLWSDPTGQMTQTATGLSPGQYFVTVTDDNGCFNIDSVQIDGPPEIVLSTSGTDADCIGSDNGTASVSVVSGGVSPFTYLWNTNDTTTSISDLPAGTYTVTVTDATDCTAEATVVVETDEPDAGTLTINADDVCLPDGGMVTIFALSNGDAVVPAGYQVAFLLTTDPNLTILDVQANPSFTVSTAGTYTIHGLVYNPNDLDPFNLAVNTALELNDLLIQGGGTICASLDVTGATAQVSDPDAGTMTIDAGNVCLDNGMAVISATPGMNAVIPPGYVQAFVLTSTPSLEILGLSTTSDFTVTAIGTYRIHSIVYDPNSDLLSNILPGTTAFEVIDLLIQGGGPYCGSLDVTGADVLVEDCIPCINVGDYVWFDLNEDGIQQNDEYGVSGVDVSLFGPGNDGVFFTVDDNLLGVETTNGYGLYLFECVPPGTYYISFYTGNLPNDVYFTSSNQGGNDNLDSDANEQSGKTALFVVPQPFGPPVVDDILHIDAGVVPFCVDVSGGGTICCDQTICAGLVPDPIVGVNPPYGGIGALEYLWLSTTLIGPFDPSTWTPIPNSNTPDYAPGPLGQTTLFIRCVRREGCGDFLVESNVVTITVIPYDPNECPPVVQNIVANFNPNKQIDISWITTNDHGTYSYTVEKATNGQVFTPISTLDAHGNGQLVNQYTYTDETPVVGTSTYRVRVDNPGGLMAYSNEVSVRVTASDLRSLFVYPNPFGEKLYIQGLSELEGGATIELYSVEGIKVSHIEIEPGNVMQEELAIPQLQKGVYVLKISYSSGASDLMKVIKTED